MFLIAQNFGVFPTHVGVFPTRLGIYINGISLPHACGGVSIGRIYTNWTVKSSPRMWGCFRVNMALKYGIKVFPTHVGVFPILQYLKFFYGRLPHACGGVSRGFFII